MKFKLFLIFTALPAFLGSQVIAQVRSFTAKEAVQYAIANSPTIKNAVIETDIAKAKVMETTTAGLPQISGSLSVLNYPKVSNDPNKQNTQKFVLENVQGPFYIPPDKGGVDGAPLAFGLQLANSLTGTVNATQLIFNGSYLVGLQASKTYRELSVKQLKQAKITLAEQVMKTYYAILVNQEKTRLLDLNLLRLDSTYKETQALFKNGFVEKIDLDRIEVSLNNLRSEKQKTTRLITLATNGLKFQMGMPVKDSIQLTENLNEVNPESIVPADPTIDYSKRIEYSTLQTQKNLAALSLKNIKAGYLPSLVGLATLGVNSAASKFKNLSNFSEKNRYAPYGYIGLSLSVPMFDGLQKKYQSQQARYNINKINNGFKQLENAIDLELNQANINLANANTSLEIQKRNLKLAEEVVRVSKVKYRQGVGSNLEVTNAESSLKESQTNYYSALYDFIIAKIDLDKAQGQLVAE
jgi:outer membrane protein TolC